MKNEIVDIVDDHDEVIGTATRDQAYAQRQTIRIVHVFVLNSTGEMACQLRSKTVSFCPEHWVTAGSGHVQAGESYEQAGQRELFEELGIEAPMTLESTERYEQPDGMKKFLAVLRATYDGKFHQHPKDVDEVQWFSLEKIQSMLSSGAKFHPEFLFLLKKRFGIT